MHFPCCDYTPLLTALLWSNPVGAQRAASDVAPTASDGKKKNQLERTFTPIQSLPGDSASLSAIRTAATRGGDESNLGA